MDSIESYAFTAAITREPNGSYTVSLDQIDLAENADTLEMAKRRLVNAIIEYAEDFNNEFDFWSSPPNRSSHIPYVLKILPLDPQQIGDIIRYYE